MISRSDGTWDVCPASAEDCGKHSGIPPCCRDFFSRVWMPGNLAWFRGLRPQSFPSVRVRDPLPFVHYVRCPGCIQCGAYIKIKPCPTP